MNEVYTCYKDRLFRLLFGSEDMKENILSLYNALNNTNYTNVDDIKIKTIDGIVYMNMKNDVAFLIDSNLSLWEQQSTFNPNMPIRGLMYFGKMYSAYLKVNRCNIYGPKLVTIPTPQFIVFYNGKQDADPVVKLRLSDAFTHKINDGEFEWTATMYNLNEGKNEELLSKCKALSDYMRFVNYVNDYLKQGYELEKAVDMTVTRCIKEDVLKSFLTKHRAEVIEVILEEFDQEIYDEGMREEGREEEKTSSIRSLMKNLKLSAEEAMDTLDIPKNERSKYMAML